MFDLPVLLADDEPQVRSLIRAVLSKYGFRVLEAGNGSIALSTVQALDGAISLLVSDYFMPGLDGGTLATRVREQFPTIPILLMSSEAHAFDCLPVDGFLAKPFVPSALVDAIRRLTPREAAPCA